MIYKYIIYLSIYRYIYIYNIHIHMQLLLIKTEKKTAFPRGGKVIVIETWFITVGVCTQVCLTVMQDFFLPKQLFLKVNLYIQNLFQIVAMCAIFQKKGKIFGNLGKKWTNKILKKFLKVQVIACNYIIFYMSKCSHPQQRIIYM